MYVYYISEGKYTDRNIKLLEKYMDVEFIPKNKYDSMYLLSKNLQDAIIISNDINILHSLIQEEEADILLSVYICDCNNTCLEQSLKKHIDICLPPKFSEDSIQELEKRADEMLEVHHLQEEKKELIRTNKVLHESIEYAALIQSALLPDNKVIRKYFNEYFVIWHPRDGVGGDVYFFDDISDKLALFVIADCTGHGVPGALVTMMVSSVYNEILKEISHGELLFSPGNILSEFNIKLKRLLKQEKSTSGNITNVGFDGAVVCYNKEKKELKYAGANCPLFCVKGNELKVIKGDRFSIGYKESDTGFVFKEHKISFALNEDGIIYLTTDGYIDQIGGDKGFPFGKKRLTKLIEEYHSYSLADQQEVFLNALEEYKGNHDQIDDITVVALRTSKTITQEEGLYQKDEDKINVMLVDDSRISRKIIGSVVKELGYNIVAEAKDGKDGLEKYKKVHPDVVLTDIEMPEMDGYEMAQKILEYDKKAKIFVITSIVNAQFIKKILSIGVLDAIKKPVNKQKLQMTLEKFL
ncbi:MAG: response regulator [Epsilonproteobacteria bacterium]|nr:response regulator [Campylobacterota bacterium]